ncbi:unnamed protein product [Rotaria sp. Silwood1]|nr:unnamed protein product [Rotaria sp. Silwood1]
MTTMSTILGMAKSYNLNSSPQLAAVEASIPFIREAIDVLDISPSSNPLIIADFGSAQGLNSMYAMKMIIEHLKKKDERRQILVIHNDLPTNDWTSLVELLNKDKSYYGLANGQSFYEQCLPMNSLSIGYSSTAIHWFSSKPCNLSDHCTFDFAQDTKERDLFKRQAHFDYALFLEQRSSELILGSVLILIILGTDDYGSTGHDEQINLLYKCAQLIKLTPKELLDYTIPLYLRSYSECIDYELFNRYSFELIKSEFNSVQMPFFKQYQDGQITLDELTQSITLFNRSWSESALKQSLLNNGRSEEGTEQLLTEFWTTYETEAKEHLYKYDSSLKFTYLILKKIINTTK